tara:strand:- start:2131 stop:2268 length:138 start_codon:yes stop_codon:yes gene_type:complete
MVLLICTAKTPKVNTFRKIGVYRLKYGKNLAAWLVIYDKTELIFR